ncbi:hypothetical protein [Streptomyces sp. NPDC012888]|uniref:hypothetical protein n=1 Tax=Streptomyces sp. NPDC012888 TaxID=3364855 RepID=UPI003696E3EB
MDTASDARVAGVRFYSMDRSGTTHYHMWRFNKNGAGTSQSWNTSLNDTRGIILAGVEAAAFNDAGYQTLCGSASVRNPYK